MLQVMHQNLKEHVIDNQKYNLEMIQVRSLIKNMTMKLMQNTLKGVVEIEKQKKDGTYVPYKIRRLKEAEANNNGAKEELKEAEVKDQKPPRVVSPPPAAIAGSNQSN